MVKIKPVFFVLVAAVVIASLAALISYNQLQKKNKLRAKNTTTQPVAVATLDLPWGTPIKKNMIKMVPYLKETIPSGSFSDTSALEGRTLIYPVKVNEPIFESKLAPTSVKEGGVAAIITPQKRAMSVKVDNVIGISGFIHPGHRVDVLATMEDRGNDSPTVTKTVLENILVLAAGTEVEKEGKKEKSTGVNVVTLEVTPEEGEKLALATTKGKIQLALRNFADTEDVSTKGATVANLFRMPVVNAPKRKLLSVTLIQGSCVSEVTF